MDEPYYLAVDPGTQKGAIVLMHGLAKPRVVDWFFFEATSNWTSYRRVKHIQKRVRLALGSMLDGYRPSHVIVEGGFVGRGALTAITIGGGRFVQVMECLEYVEDARNVVEVSPSEVKKAATGRGGASKLEVRTGVVRALGVDDDMPEDFYDAAAVGLAGARIIREKYRKGVQKTL